MSKPKSTVPPPTPTEQGNNDEKFESIHSQIKQKLQAATNGCRNPVPPEQTSEGVGTQEYEPDCEKFREH